jgi:hypothetical protein
MQKLSVICLFCDDVREEKSGTETLVGVLPDNLSIDKIPSAIPKLGMYFRIHLDPKFDPGRLTTKLKMEDGSVIELGEIDRSVLDRTRVEAEKHGAPITGLIFRAIASPFSVPFPGRVLAILDCDGEEYLAGSLNFILTT